MKSGNLNLLEPSGPHRACYETALALPSVTGISPCLKFTAYTHYWKGLLVIRGRTGSCKTFRKISLVMTK